MARSHDDAGPGIDQPHRTTPPPIPRRYGQFSWTRTLIALGVALVGVYLLYLWFIVRVVVSEGEVLVLMRKDGSRSLPGDQVVIPKAPDPGSPQYAQWEKEYGDCNGILEEVKKSGTYFGFSPFDYERTVEKMVVVPPGKVGIVVRKFGKALSPGHVLASDGERGPLPGILQPGRYPQYSSPLAYEVLLVEPTQVDPGHRGVVTIMAGPKPKNSNSYLVAPGEQGVQPDTEPEGLRYNNPFEKRIIPVTIQSQRYDMTGAEAITFPSSDSFDMKMEGFVEWSIIPDKVPQIYVEYAEGGSLIKYMEDKVILPYARSYSRLVGSQYTARDFISGDTRLKFQNDFEQMLRAKCHEQGIEILQAGVRDIVPPESIKSLINEREIAKQQIRSLEQQIQVAKSQADLARQTEMATQNEKIGEANKQVVTITKKAEQDMKVALTKAQQDLAVAKLRLDAAQKQADALIAKGQADAAVVLLNKQAEAEPLRRQVEAFGDGDAYAQYFFYQKVAPAMKSILTNTDGPFADLFKQFNLRSTTARPTTMPTAGLGGNEKLSGVQQ